MAGHEKTGAWARYRAIAREMAAEGHSLIEVAETLGLHKASLEEALEGHVQFGNHGRHRQISCFITLRRIAYFRAAAALRGVSIGSLISRLLVVIADDDLLKSVLDDNPRGPRKAKTEKKVA